MKKLTLILLCLLWSSLMCSCIFRGQGSLDIDEQVEEMILYLDYTDCHIASIGDYYNCNALPISVSEQEVNEIIAQYLMQYPSENKSDKTCIEAGDLVIISYKIIELRATIIDVERQVVLAGEENFDSLIEQSVIGKKIGKTYSIDYHNPSLGIEDAECFITPQYIYTLSDAQLNDAFVQKYFNYSSLEEWEDSIKQELYNQKKESAWKTILGDIIKCSFFDIDQECILNQATDLAYQTQLQAIMEGLTLDEYVAQTMGISKDEFYNECYSSCLRDVQEYLIVGAIAKKEKFEVTEIELAEYCSQQGLEENSLSTEEKTYASYYILRNKVINFVCN